MNPDRWAAIVGTFAEERGENKSGSARRSVSHQRLNNVISREEGTQNLIPPNFSDEDHKIHSANVSNNLEEDDHNIINVLQRIIKEKAKVIQAQNQKISSLAQELALLKRENEARNVPTGESSESKYCSVEKDNEDINDGMINTSETISQMEKCRPALEADEKSEPLLEIITEKMELMEKRIDALVTFIQGHFPKSSYSKLQFEKLGKEVHPPPPIPTKAWTKPPTLQPRASYCSVLREAHSRTGSNNKVNTREGCNSTGNATQGPKFCAYPRINEEDPVRDTHHDPVVEQRLQFLESLVAQLKGKFMKVLQVQRRHMAMTRGVK